MRATLIFDDRRGLKAVCGLLLLTFTIAPLSLAGNNMARAQEGGLLDFFSMLPGKPQLAPPELGVLAPWADDMKKARAAYFKGEYEKARRYLEPAAVGGDITASSYLGHMYRLGRGVEASTLKALQYYQDVADAFNPDEPDPHRFRIMIDALVRVADIYREGDPEEGLQPNPKAAFRLYTTAANFGHPSANYAQGLMWLTGMGVKANTAKALRYLRHAAKKRHPPAEALLGDLYWIGEAVERDRREGLKWYVLATQSARPEEYPAIFDRYNEMASQASDDQLREAESRAQAWTENYPLPPPPQGAWPGS